MQICRHNFLMILVHGPQDQAEDAAEGAGKGHEARQHGRDELQEPLRPLARLHALFGLQRGGAAETNDEVDTFRHISPGRAHEKKARRPAETHGYDSK